MNPNQKHLEQWGTFAQLVLNVAQRVKPLKDLIGFLKSLTKGDNCLNMILRKADGGLPVMTGLDLVNQAEKNFGANLEEAKKIIKEKGGKSWDDLPPEYKNKIADQMIKDSKK